MMDFNIYRANEDVKLIRKLLGMTQAEMAQHLDTTQITVNRWETGGSRLSEESLEKFYSFVYDAGIKISEIKAQFLKEELPKDRMLLFHGAKEIIEGEVSVEAGRRINDIGQGFYMGESYDQAALFVSRLNDSCVYMLSFDTKDLKKAEYHVDREWLLTIAAYRQRLDERFSLKAIKELKQKVEKADYIVAPIADNRMYRIIDSFIDEEITDEQCIHALAATNLGMQYVARTQKAAERIDIHERCYLCAEEKKKYVEGRRQFLTEADHKVRAARIKYRGKGKYIDELL